MTTRKPNAKPKPTALNVDVKKGDHPGVAVASKLNAPYNRHALTICHLQGRLIKEAVPDEANRPNMVDYANDLKARGEAIASGDLTLASHLLVSQALTLDNIFSEMALRSAMNMGEYIDASERYMRLALKAQANSRATIEALARLHQPREQTVRHVHVSEGGQAVIADQFHHHAGGNENGQSAEQPHAAGATCSGPSLPSPNPIGNGVPVSGSEGQPAMQDARREGKRRA